MCAVLGRAVFLLPFIGFIFYIEMFSVMAQVAWFQWTKRRHGEGKRLFRRAPCTTITNSPVGLSGVWSLRSWCVNLITSAIGLVLCTGHHPHAGREYSIQYYATRKELCCFRLARAGVPAARFLASRGAQIRGYDSKPLEELSGEARDLENAWRGAARRQRRFPAWWNARRSFSRPLEIHHEPLCSVLAECAAHGCEIIGELELAARHCPRPSSP
jgi:hypothetical protein